MEQVAINDEQVHAASPGLWRQIKEDWQANGRDWTRPGFRALAVHRFGVWRMGVRSKLLRMPLSMLYRALYRYVRNHYSIELHYTVKVGRHVVIGHQGAIVIHDHAEIGDHCVIRQGVTLGASSHRRAYEAPKLRNGVQVGAGAMVLGDIVIGEGAAIGVNAVVTENVPCFAKVVAAPSRVIQAKPRSAELSPRSPLNHVRQFCLAGWVLIIECMQRTLSEAGTEAVTTATQMS